MAVEDDLLAQIETALGQAIVSSLDSASHGSDLFEAYLWTLVVEAANRQGAVTPFVNVETDGTFVFPTSPRTIYSANNYSYARIEFPGCPPLEAHLDIFVSGRSEVPHECDVAVVDANEAALCRQQSVHPRRSKVLLAVEGKFYAGTLELGQARAFLGLLEEIHRPDRFLLTNALSHNVSKMLAKHRCGWQTGVVPEAVGVVRNAVSQFEEVFKNYRAQFGA